MKYGYYLAGVLLAAIATLILFVIATAALTSCLDGHGAMHYWFGYFTDVSKWSWLDRSTCTRSSVAPAGWLMLGVPQVIALAISHVVRRHDITKDLFERNEQRRVEDRLGRL